MFTSYLFEPFLGILDLEKKSINAIGGWDSAVILKTPDDIGKLIAKIFFTEPQIENELSILPVIPSLTEIWLTL